MPPCDTDAGGSRPLLRPAARDGRAPRILVRPAPAVRRLVDAPRMLRATWSYLEAVPPRQRGSDRRSDPVPPRWPFLDGPLRRPCGRRATTFPGLCTSSDGGRSNSRSASAASRWTSAASTSAGARGEPSEGDPLYGLYQHKRAFGGRWLELTGAHERVYDARGYALGRVAGQVRRRLADDARPIRRRRRAPSRRCSPPPNRPNPRRSPASSSASSSRVGSAAPGATAGRSDRPGWPRSRSAASPTTPGPSEPGSLFVAVPGLHVDGHDYVARGRRAGAAAAIVERPVPEAACRSSSSPPRQPPSRPPPRGGTATRLASWASSASPARTARRPPRSSPSAALEAAGIRTGMTGTAATRIGGVRRRTPRTRRPPRRPRSRPPLRAMVAAGDAPRSSRPRRTDSPSAAWTRIAYDVAILTNLTHEHLELHGTWEAYRDAKLSPVRAARDRPRRRPAEGSRRRRLAEDRHRQRRRPVGGRVHRRRPRRPAPAS